MKNIEIEHKYKVKDLKKICQKLDELGAKSVGRAHGVDSYFIVPNNPEGRKYLRVREKDGKAEISYTVVESESDTHEWETTVGDAEMTAEILTHLGFAPDVTVDKQRETYKYKDSEVVLDEVKNLGCFVEVESPSLEELLMISGELGLGEDVRVKGMGYPDLIRGHLISN